MIIYHTCCHICADHDQRKQDPWTAADGEWAIRETFVAVITTNIPPIAPLIRKWLSPCLGRMEVSERSNSPNYKPSSQSPPSRSVSKASLKAQERFQHNEAMTDRYFSGVGSQEYLPAYNTTNKPRTNSAASNERMDDEMELEEHKGSEWKDTHVAHALSTPGQEAVYPAMHGREEDALPQKAREIV